MGNPHIRRIDSTVQTTDRARAIENFAPVANGYPEIAGTDQEIDILVSTDVLSEGQNLQDCGYLINYDLHWNPTRMVQRAGRIDRLGSSFDVLHIYNMFPERALEELLGLVRSLTAKIEVINQTGFSGCQCPRRGGHAPRFQYAQAHRRRRQFGDRGTGILPRTGQ